MRNNDLINLKNVNKDLMSRFVTIDSSEWSLFKVSRKTIKLRPELSFWF
jgi:hypothetical protein